jgi:hypothetical protein
MNAEKRYALEAADAERQLLEARVELARANLRDLE